MKVEYIVNKKDENKSINEILMQQLDFSNRLLAKVIRKKCVYLNNKICDTRSIVKKDDAITVDLNYEEDNSNIVPKKMNLNIIYEDEWFIVLNKPKGIAIHPSCEHFDNTLSNGLRAYFDEISLKKKIRPINRLDLNTSGLCVFAKCEYVQELFAKQMENNEFKKFYLCIVEGHLKEKTGTLSFPISRKDNSIIEREVNINGQPCITHYKVLKEYKNLSLIECMLETGRTHQIRVHFSYIGHPLLGDSLYGNPSNLISGQALHSYKISFIHPILKKEISFCNLQFGTGTFDNL